MVILLSQARYEGESPGGPVAEAVLPLQGAGFEPWSGI